MGLSAVILAFIFITGLVVGSFLNVVILRTVSEESIVFPGSKCPKCQNPLKWYHNIPILSYIFLGGKCAYCKEHISIQYPMVELLTGIIFIGLFVRFCNPFDPLFGLRAMNPISINQVIVYIFALFVSCNFIALAGTDILEQKVSDAHTYSLIGGGIVFSLITSILVYIYGGGFSQEFSWHAVLTCPIFYAIAGAILGFLVMEAVARLGILLVGNRAFGEGDSYIAAGLGSVFGSLIGISPFYSNFLAVAQALGEILILSVIIQLIFTVPVFFKKLIISKNWFTLGTLAGFIIYTLCFVYAQNIGWLTNAAALWTSLIVLILLGLLACKELLFGLKENKLNATYLPFGPAMVIAGFLALIFLPL